MFPKCVSEALFNVLSPKSGTLTPLKSASKTHSLFLLPQPSFGDSIGSIKLGMTIDKGNYGFVVVRNVQCLK